MGRVRRVISPQSRPAPPHPVSEQEVRLAQRGYLDQRVFGGDVVFRASAQWMTAKHNLVSAPRRQGRA